MQKRQNKHPDPTPWLFLAPSLCGVTLFVLAPFVETVRRSVTDTMGRHFVGLANYTAVLGNDAFRLAVENTVRFIGVCVPLLLEAAAIDGATPWQQFARIGLPVGLPGILAALTMSFLDAWNALEQPMTFLKTQSLWSLSLYLTDTTRDLALTMAASLFALLPAVLIFAFGQKYLEQGILAGAVKG